MSDKSQLRKYIKFTLKNKCRSFIGIFKGVIMNYSVHIDKNVEFLRYPKNISIDNNVVLKEGAKICSCNEGAKVSIGENTTFGYHSFIFCSNKVEIGNNCLIAPFVYIVDSDHEIEKGQLINQQANTTAPIKIGDDVWIGTGAKILKGVTIANGAVIAAGSLVKSDVGENEIFGGVPAKKISERK